MRRNSYGMSETSRRNTKKKNEERTERKNIPLDSKKNRLVRADSLSRSHTIDISWEHGAFFDVGDAEEAGGDALQADGEAAVRGHAVSPPLCSLSRAPQARISPAPHSISAPRPHPLLRGIQGMA